MGKSTSRVSCCHTSLWSSTSRVGARYLYFLQGFFNCLWNNWSMNDTFGKDCLKRFWVKCKAVMNDEMRGHSRTLHFILDSVPDLSKRSIWALKALTYTSEPGMWPEFSVTATDAYLTITSFFKSLIKFYRKNTAEHHSVGQSPLHLGSCV